ncbi:hypothetical protein BGX30_012732, partial [Mortierella sp. GBA39]
PAGVYTKQVREMNEKARESGRIFGMMFNQRTNPMYRKMHELVHSGKLGAIKRVEDDVTAYMEFPNGATGVFVTTTADLPGTNRLEITLEMGKLVCENNTLTLHKLSQNEREYCFTTKDGFATPPVEVSVIETQGDNSQHTGVIASFAKAVLDGEPLIADGEEGINSLMLSNAMHLSSWIGDTVALPIDEDLFLEELNKRIAASKNKVTAGI